MEKTEHAGSPEGRLNAAAKPRPLATQTPGPTEGKRPSFEFRGFDFFAKRDFNELKSASDAYFAPKAKRISRALGITSHPSVAQVAFPGIRAICHRLLQVQ